MGGGGSKPPPPPPVVTEAPYPGGGVPDTINPGKPVLPRKSGVGWGTGTLAGDLSISKANQCKDGACKLEIIPAVSSSSVKLTRKFGDILPSGCNYQTEWEKMWYQRMSVKDFVGGLQAGNYYRKIDSGDYCEQVKLPDDIANKIVTINDMHDNRDKLQTIRIRQVSTGGFSSDTKALLTPSIPLKMSFNGVAFDVTTITVYHPCPLKIQDQQADAVISLNDPSVGNPSHVVLIPITTGNSYSTSAEFFSKIASQIATIASPDPVTGQYMTTDIQTGEGWSLSKILPIKDVTSKAASPVTAGLFTWSGIPALEKYLAEDTPSVKRYDWRPVTGQKAPTYILFEKSLPVNAADLSTVTRYLPVTPPSEAIHAIIEPVLYKPCAATPSTSVIERFEVGASCNPFLNNAINDTNNFDTDKVVTIVFGILLGLAALIGAYLALTAVSKSWDVEYAEFSKNAGKVAGVWAKNVQGKVSALTSKASGLSSMAKNPTAALGNAAGIGDIAKNPMAALGDMPKNPMAALGDMPKVPTIAAPRLKRK